MNGTDWERGCGAATDTVNRSNFKRPNHMHAPCPLPTVVRSRFQFLIDFFLLLPPFSSLLEECRTPRFGCLCLSFAILTHTLTNRKFGTFSLFTWNENKFICLLFVLRVAKLKINSNFNNLLIVLILSSYQRKKTQYFVLLIEAKSFFPFFSFNF